MKLKVCGVRTSEAIQACQDRPVDFVGFNFVPSSKRFVSLEVAHQLSHAFTGHKVAVFQNASVETILETLAVVDLDIIQLHGNEDLAFITDLKQAFAPTHNYAIWKAVSPDEAGAIKTLPTFAEPVDLILLDGAQPGSGRAISNQTNLTTAIKICEALNLPYGLAGGINPSTIENKLNTFPSASLVDTASGIETNGQLDRSKLNALINAIRSE